MSLNSLMRWWGQRDDESGDGEGDRPPRAIEDVLVTPEIAPQEPWLTSVERAGIPRTLTYPSTTLARLLDQTADRFGDAPAVAYQNVRWTYAELLARVNRVAAGLATLGVRKGDHV
ncbi:MAG: AMP-binding protein, partial [Phycisphaerae bacterium]